MQYVETKTFFGYLFWINLIFYCLPLVIFLLSEDYTHRLICIILGTITSTLFLLIEIIQMYDQGKEYLSGWNFVDVM